MKFMAMASILSVVLTIPVVAQTAATPAFEVASIKPDESGGNRVEVTPGGLSAHSATLATCIMWAYGVQGSQLSGADSAVSKLLQSDRYSIVAKTAGPVSDSELRTMFQALLAERFHLTVHKQNREIQVLALVVDKSGSKLHPSEGDGESQQQASSKMARRWKWTTMPQLASNLGEAMQVPVLDQTGLTGKYDFAVDLTPYFPTAGERPDIGAMMVTAVKDQLGLKLESHKAPTDVLVIDHLEKPSAN